MSDRSKEEILARELCMQYYRGTKVKENLSNEVSVPVEQLVDKLWPSWKRQARELLGLLETHKDEDNNDENISDVAKLAFAYNRSLDEN